MTKRGPPARPTNQDDSFTGSAGASLDFGASATSPPFNTKPCRYVIDRYGANFLCFLPLFQVTQRHRECHGNLTTLMGCGERLSARSRATRPPRDRPLSEMNHRYFCHVTPRRSRSITIEPSIDPSAFFVGLQSLGFSFPLVTVARTDTSHPVYGSFTTLMVFGEERSPALSINSMSPRSDMTRKEPSAR